MLRGDLIQSAGKQDGSVRIYQPGGDKRVVQMSYIRLEGVGHNGGIWKNQFPGE